MPSRKGGPKGKGSRREPQVQPLRIKRARGGCPMTRGKKLIFLEGRSEHRIPLVIQKRLTGIGGIKGDLSPLRLQGVYRTPSGLVTLRSQPGEVPHSAVGVFRFEPKTKHEMAVGFFSKTSDLDHMFLPEELRGIGLHLKGAGAAERHVRALKGGSHVSLIASFPGVFRNLGYHVMEQPGADMFHIDKGGEHVPEDNLDRFHRIEVVRPDGQIETITIPIEGS